MICPQTKAECGHLASCDITGKCMGQLSAELDKTDAEIRNSISIAMQAPPTLAEIEGLVNTFEQQTINCYMHGLGNHAEWKAARAALMAAIRLYVQE